MFNKDDIQEFIKILESKKISKYSLFENWYGATVIKLGAMFGNGGIFYLLVFIAIYKFIAIKKQIKIKIDKFSNLKLKQNKKS